MGRVIIIRKKLVALVQIRSHESHDKVVRKAMLTDVHCTTSVHLEIAVVGCVGVAERVRFESPFDRFIFYMCDDPASVFPSGRSHVNTTIVYNNS